MNQPHLLSPAGFHAGAMYAGIKSREMPDVGVLLCDTPATAAAVFTDNKVVAPGVIIGRNHVSRGKLRGVVVNSGNANSCTGKQGMRDAIEMCRLAAKRAECDPHEFLPSSTGIIGHLLPMDKIKLGIEGSFDYLGSSHEHSLRFGDAILTTDTKRKQAAARFKLGKETITIAGVCKGSGMIGPSLHATMLAYLTTDAKIAPPLLRKLMQQAAEMSFNAVTVDDHSSTNDTACILASGAVGSAITSAKDVAKFAAALNEVSQSLAYQIAADGEGATKVVKIEITGAKTEEAAKKIARTIANSNLVKTAMHGNDPNWGRIVSAAGMAHVPFDPETAVLKLQKTIVYRKGQPVAFDAAKVSQSLGRSEVLVELACNIGKAAATCWTCDLSREYITINADYHT